MRLDPLLSPRFTVPLLGLIAVLVYLPGLSGGFLFDDLINLDALGRYGAVDNAATFLRYLSSGEADPVGRPLSLLSFLIDARNWPAEPAPFLRTNLILHLVNGALLMALLARLERALGATPQRARAVSCLGAGLWLLHPLFVSTTLYIVQREAMLPVTFVLLGLLAYVHGRRLAVDGQSARASTWMIAGIAGGTALAVLCKANGILLPLLAGVLELSVGQRMRPPDEAGRRSLRRLGWILFGPAALLVAALVLAPILQPTGASDMRPWSVGQRLLTEPRVLVDYLRLLAVPRAISSGLYNDQWTVSTDWLHPASTLPSVVFVLGLAVLGWWARKSRPALSAALLFFLVGHLLESTTLPLELYFEHRNYLPALLLPWPLARAIAGLRTSVQARMLVGAVLLALLASVTWQRAGLWGQPAQMAQLWSRQNPGSSRAQATAALELLHAGRTQQAINSLRATSDQRPGDLQVVVTLTDALCDSGGLQAADVERLRTALLLSRGAGNLPERWLGHAIDGVADGRCPGLGYRELQAWIDADARGAGARAAGADLRATESLTAQLETRRGQPDLALTHFNRSLREQVEPGVALSQAAFLASAGDYAQALAHLDYYDSVASLQSPAAVGMPRVHAWILARQHYWPDEMSRFRRQLKDAMRD